MRGSPPGTHLVSALAIAALFTPGASLAEEPPPTPAATETAGRPRRPPRGINDQRRTIRSYGSNLAYNFLGVVTPGNHKPLLVTGALTTISFAWDDEGIRYFEQHPQTRFGEIGAAMGGSLAVAGLTVGAFSAGRVARGDRFRATTYDLSQAILVTGVYTHAIKLAVGRERPDGSNNRSFPSGHASNAFTVATVITRHYPKLTLPGFAVASYIALSRMAASKHHFSDVVAGAGFGFGAGRAVVRRNSRPPDGPPPARARTVTVLHDPGPARDGHGLRIAVTF